jgi:hypothetical protein
LDRKYALKDREPKDLFKSLQGLQNVDSLATAKKFGLEMDILCRKMTQMGKEKESLCRSRKRAFVEVEREPLSKQTIRFSRTLMHLSGH